LDSSLASLSGQKWVNMSIFIALPPRDFILF
jgi:hypothetical protein